MTGAWTPTPARPPGPSLRLSIVLIIAGLALAIPTLIAGVVPIIRNVTTSARFEVPNQVRVHLGEGTYMLYEGKGATSIGSAFSSDDSVTITPEDVTVTRADGGIVVVFDRGTIRETLNSGNERFVGAARFTTPSVGDYTISVRSATPKVVLIGRPLTDTIQSVLGWFALSTVGGLTFIAGIVLLIVGSVRRGRVRTATAYASAVPPGWHPDPGGSGRMRYWDGYRWTEHVQ